jgi:hypothetical protein
MVTFGIGASGFWSRGRRTAVDAAGKPVGPTVETRLASLAPQVSLNFGKRDGWSYISAGIGRSIYTMRRTDVAAPSSVPRVRTLNFGAGARWFARKHVAFSFDLRWYALDGQDETAETPAVPRTTRMVDLGQVTQGLGTGDSALKARGAGRILSRRSPSEQAGPASVDNTHRKRRSPRGVMERSVPREHGAPRCCPHLAEGACCRLAKRDFGARESPGEQAHA